MTELYSKSPDPVLELCGGSPITFIAFDEQTNSAHNLQHLFSGHQDGKILCWSLKTQRVLHSHDKAHTESVLWIACPVSSICFSQGREGCLKFWKIEQQQWVFLGEICTASYTFCNSDILNYDHHSLLATPDYNTSIVAVYKLPNDFTPYFESSATLETKLTPSLVSNLAPSSAKDFGMCMKICIFIQDTEEGPRVLIGYESGLIALWNVETSTLLRKVQAFTDSVMCMDVCCTKNVGIMKVTVGSVETDLKSWLVSSDELKQDHCVSITNAGLGSVAARKDGRMVATGGWDGRCRIFTASKLRPLAVLCNHKESVQCVAFSPDKKLATGSKDGYISLWNVYADK